MEQSDLLHHMATTLDRLDLPYLVTGSTATITFGEPRFTNDIDIVVKLPLERLDEFWEAFPEGEFYLDPNAAREAIRRKTQFNIVHPASGLKVDIVIPDDSPFERSRFARVLRVETAPGCRPAFSSPEDVIIKKLEFHRQGGSDKHLRDILGVLKVMGDQIDRAYIAQWAARLGVDAVWREVLGSLAK